MKTCAPCGDEERGLEEIRTAWHWCSLPPRNTGHDWQGLVNREFKKEEAVEITYKMIEMTFKIPI